MHLFDGDAALLVFAALVLEPDPDDSGRQTRHLHQLFPHQRIWPRVGVVARTQSVQLLLVQNCPDPGRFGAVFAASLLPPVGIFAISRRLVV